MLIQEPGSFMGIMQQTMVGVWNVFSTDLAFPQPIGMLSPGDILLFFAICYLVADTMGSIAERRD